MNPYAQGDLFDPATVSWVLSDSDLPGLRSAIMEAIEVVIDLETTSLDEHARGEKWKNGGVPARIVLASLTLPRDEEDDKPPTYVVPLSHPHSTHRGRWVEVITEIVEAIRDSRAPITNANLKFDLRWLAAFTGIDLSPQFFWDTQISSHLIDENESTKLKERVPATFGVERWDDFDLSRPGAAEKVPLIDLGLYAARDTYWTWRLAVLHRELMGIGHDEEPEDAEEAQMYRLGELATFCAMPMTANLTAIEIEGFGVDLEWIEARAKDAEQGRKEHEEWLLAQPWTAGLGPDVSWAATSKWWQAFTAAAVEAGALEVTAFTGTGAPQWNKSVLTRQAREGNEVAQHVLALRGFIKELEYLHSWLEKAAHTSHDGAQGSTRVYTTYHAGRVVTGRLSSSEPNVQQVTKRLKPAFVPRPGYYIADLDYSQIELRSAAHIAQCAPMIEAFIRGDDLHKLLAARITGHIPAHVTDEERQAGKSANFGLLYGMSADGFRDYALDTYGVNFTADEAVQVRDAFFEQWIGMDYWHDKMVNQAYNRGYVVSPLGRVRRVPHIHGDNDFLRGRAERQAINSPVQSFASDMMQMAAASIGGHLQYGKHQSAVPGVRLLGTVHDSIIAEVPIDDWQRATARMMRRMLDLDEVLHRLGCDLTVPLAVDATVSTRWGLKDIGTIS